MRLSSLFLGLASLSLLGGLLSCAKLEKMLSKPPTIVERAWQQETVFVESNSGMLGVPSLFVDGQGQPGVAVADESFYVGMQSIALGRRTAQGWRVEFPYNPSAARVCARAEGDAVVISHGDLEGPLQALSWNGETAAQGEPQPCPAPKPTVSEASSDAGTHKIELSKDARTLFHQAPSGEPCPPHDSSPDQVIEGFALALDADGNPTVALFEHPIPEEDEPPPGQLRHSVCKAGVWTSSIVAHDLTVTRVSMIVAGDRTHLAYVSREKGAQRLVHATPLQGAPPPVPEADARVIPALEACLRVREQPTVAALGIGAYQAGDGFRCAVLERDPDSGKQALTVATARCEEGQAPACALAGSLYNWLMGEVSITLEVPQGPQAMFHTQWSGLRPAGVKEDLVAAAELYGRACDAGDKRACLHQAVLLEANDPLRFDRALLACRAKHAPGCALAVATKGMRPKKKLAGLAAPVLRKACEAGDLASCNNLGVVRHAMKKAAGARDMIDRACKGALPHACNNLGRLPYPR